MAEPQSPRVAVVVPCHDDGAFLPDAIESIRAQEPCELVVVDDGSTDPTTLSVLTRLEREGVRIVRQENAGPAAARMTGVRATIAPYIHPLDADDLLAPGALEALADALDQTGASAAWGDYQSFGAENCHFPQAQELDPWRITFVMEVPGTSLFERDMLEEVAGWDLKAAFEDWDFWLKLAGRGASGVRVPRVTLHYRVHPEGRRYGLGAAQRDELHALLRMRHAELFRARRRNWRRSPSPVAIKLLFPLVDAIPGVSQRRKQQLFAVIRKMFQPELSSSCFPGVLGLLRRELVRALTRRRMRAA
jgi:glycosyltransferase involved in cell wall biosynthesis